MLIVKRILFGRPDRAPGPIHRRLRVPLHLPQRHPARRGLAVIPPALDAVTIKRLCLDCAGLIDKGKRRCPRCLAEFNRRRNAARNRARPTANGQKKLRAEVLLRDGHTCRRCGRRLPASELEVHHVIPCKDGGPDHPANAETVCRTCHRGLPIRRGLDVPLIVVR